MRFSVWPRPQQSWDDLVELARHAETTGWDGVWMADHFMPNGDDLSAPVLECWSTIAALAVAVPRLRIGSLVSGNTYRHPAVLANAAATIDRISGGRLVVGLGAGWQENEHHAYGIPFPDVSDRLARLEEACRVVKGLTTAERTTLEGEHFQLDDAPMEPKPVQDPLPLLVGGGGERVTLRIAAQYADEWNVWGTPETVRHKIEVLERHCDDVGRDPASIRRSAQSLLFMTEDQGLLRALRANHIPLAATIGTPDEVREVVAAYAEAGVDELVVPDFNLGLGDERRAVYDAFVEEIAPEFRGPTGADAEPAADAVVGDGTAPAADGPIVVNGMFSAASAERSDEPAPPTPAEAGEPPEPPEPTGSAADEGPTADDAAEPAGPEAGSEDAEAADERRAPAGGPEADAGPDAGAADDPTPTDPGGVPVTATEPAKGNGQVSEEP